MSQDSNIAKNNDLGNLDTSHGSAMDSSTIYRSDLTKQLEDDRVDAAIFWTFFNLLASICFITLLSPAIGLAIMILLFTAFALYYAIF
jgi:hypothetical protein